MKKKYRVWVMLPENKKTGKKNPFYYTENLVSTHKFLDQKFIGENKWIITKIYDKKTGEELGTYHNSKHKETRPGSPQEL